MSPDPHAGPVPPGAWAADDTARRRGRVEIFNATRPGGLDGWTMDLLQYELVREHILDVLAGPLRSAQLRPEAAGGVEAEERRRAVGVDRVRLVLPDRHDAGRRA